MVGCRVYEKQVVVGIVVVVVADMLIVGIGMGW